LIQSEKNSGLSGNRYLQLAIGVPPEGFDQLIQDMRQIGSLISVRIDKTDKTNEYKELNANRVSLEKTRSSLLTLKNKAGRIDEHINLENRILEIENEIQGTGVKLGEYDQENELCTVRFGLQERRDEASGIPFSHRVNVALTWAIKYYLSGLGLLTMACLLSLLAVLLLEKLKWIPAAAVAYSRNATSQLD
jgi:hypothetical protein